MSNPVFNAATVETSAGWAVPAGRQSSRAGALPVVSAERTMTLGGTVTAALVLLTLAVVAASFGWFAVTEQVAVDGSVVLSPAPFMIVAMIVGFVAVLVASFRPALAVVAGPVYALGFGYAVGSISRMYDSVYDGIVLQALATTVAVAVVMLVAYVTGVVKVTERFRRTVVFATLGVVVLYLVSFVASLFGLAVPFMASSSPLGIAVSFVIAGVAAFNLALDFDNIERGVAAQMPRRYEWVAALGLVVTLVWLYLELLRLFSKVRS